MAVEFKFKTMYDIAMTLLGISQLETEAERRQVFEDYYKDYKQYVIGANPGLEERETAEKIDATLKRNLVICAGQCADDGAVNFVSEIVGKTLLAAWMEP